MTYIQWLGRYFQLGEMCFTAGLQFSHAVAMRLAAVVFRGQLWFHGLLSIHGPHIGGRLLLDKAGFRSQGGRKVLHAVATAAVLGSHSRGPVLGLKTHLDVAHLFGPRLLSANAVAKQGPESALLC